MGNSTKSKAFLGNNKVMVLLSLLLAIFIWIGFTLNEADDVVRVVENVPVTIDDSLPSQLGLQAFGVEDLTVDVKVTGPRYLVGDNVLTADNLSVTAKAAQVDEAGSYTLLLSAKSKDDNADYVVQGPDATYVEVYFDKPVTKTVPLESVVKCNEDALVKEEYTTADPVLSTETVTVTGPATKVEDLAHVYATVTTDGDLKKTTVLEPELKAVDKDGVKLKYISFKEKNVTVTIPVYKLVELPLTVEVENLPDGVKADDFTMKVSPETALVTVDAEKAKAISFLSLGTIDYGDLKPGKNKLKFSAEDITEGIPQNPKETYHVVITLPPVEQ